MRQVVNSSGVTQATFYKDEYGKPTASTGSSELLAHTYVGALGVRNETGTPSGTGPVAPRSLYYMNQRWYDPAIGRWLRPDPIGFAGGLNLYAYAANAPANLVDFTGLAPSNLQAIYNEIYNDAERLLKTQKSGLDVTCKIMHEIADKSSSLGDFDLLMRSIFIPNSALDNWKFRLIIPKSGLQGNEPWLRFPTTGWDPGWQDYEFKKQGQPYYDQIHHFVAFIRADLVLGKGAHRLVRRVDSPNLPSPNWADIWLGDLGVDFGEELKQISLSDYKAGSNQKLKDLITNYCNKFKRPPTGCKK